MEKTKIVNYPTKKNFKKAMVATALGLSLAMGTTSVPVLNNVATVEAAKRDKKKPKIKLFGQKKLEVTEGEQVTIPKTTYSDNQTKKKKLKVGVTVKKGNKNYKSIANKIKTATVKNKPVTVTFDEEGTYKITTTVTDLAKNKATAVRMVTVNDKQEVIEEEQVITKQDSEVTTTTEQPKQEEPKREEKTTEEPKKEETVNGKKILNTDLSKFGDVKEIEINGNKYKVIEGKQITGYEFDNDATYTVSNMTDDFLKSYNAIIGENSPYADEKYFPLYFFGKITAEKGDYDYSNNVFITLYDVDSSIYKYKEADVLYVDENDKLKCISYNYFYKGNYKELIDKYEDLCPGVEWNTTYFYDDTNEFRIMPSPVESNYSIGTKTLKLVPKSK